MRYCLLFIIFILIGLVIENTDFNAYAQSNAINEQLDRLNRDIERTRQNKSQLDSKAGKLQADLKVLKRDLIRMAQELQNQEAVVSRLELQLKLLEQDNSTRNQEIGLHYNQISQAIHLFSNYHQADLVAILMQETPPDEVFQGLIVMASLLPQVSDRARLLNEDVKSLSNLQQVINIKLSDLEDSKIRLNEGKERLETLVARNLDQYKITERSRQVKALELLALGNEAASLNELITKLNRPRPPLPSDGTQESRDAESQGVEGEATPLIAPLETDGETQENILLAKPEGIRPFPNKASQLALPVRGTLIRHYGDDLEIGGTSKGISVRARADAQVIAPFDGKVAFAGTFREFGLVVILEHDGGYHSVLAGMDELNVVPQQWLLAGEPVGNLADQEASEAAILYVELRKDGQSMDPQTYFDFPTS